MPHVINESDAHLIVVAGEDLGDRPAGARQPFRLTLRPYTDAGQAIDHP
jgi:hypothetical protein